VSPALFFNTVAKDFIFGRVKMIIGSFEFFECLLQELRSLKCVPGHVRRDILGHSSSSMTGDYTHASPEEMERAMEAVAGYNQLSSKSSAKRDAAALPAICRCFVSD
jgi:hypothetical protein